MKTIPPKKNTAAKVQRSMVKKIQPSGVARRQALALTEAREALSELVKKATAGKQTFLGKSTKFAKSFILPPGEFGPQSPTVIHEISIDELRRRFKTVREEVENSGAAYRILVNGKEAATLSPTQSAWDSKISRGRANMLSSIMESMDKKIDELVKIATDAEARADAMDMRVTRLLALSEEWFKWWRMQQGHPPIP